MNRSLVSRALRSLAVVSLVVGAAACGGSDTTRQRNSALPDTTALFGDQVAFEASWVPEQRTVSLSIEVSHIIVDLYAGEEKVDSTSVGLDNSGPPRAMSVEIPEALLTDQVTKLVVTARFRDPGTGDTFSEAVLEFDRSVGAVKTAEIKPPPNDGGATTTTVDPTTDAVVRLPKGMVDIRQRVELPQGLNDTDELEISTLVKMAPDAASDATFTMLADLVSSDGTMVGQTTEFLVTEDRTVFSRLSSQFGRALAGANGDLIAAVQISLIGDAKSNEPGYKSAVITSASIKLNGTELLTNPGFDAGNEGWTSSVTFWDDCANGSGGNPCTGTDAPSSPSDSTVPTDPSMPSDTTMPTDTTTVDTTPDTTLSPADEIRERITFQEEECAVAFNAPTRTLALCDDQGQFEEVLVAGFTSDGNFTDVVKGTGQQVVLPERFVGEGRAAILRIAVASKPEGIDIATFRGEGILQIGDGSLDAQGSITVSPEGTEAFNDSGPPNEMWVGFNSDTNTFDIWQWDETKFAFLTLNGKVYDYYEDVAPPEGWTEGEPLFWRAYALDGFGLPRLAANGSISPGEDYPVMYSDPFFELVSSSIEVIAESFEEFIAMVESDPCFGTAPYLITDPVTPSGKSRVTLTVDRDCDSPIGLLGLAVFGEDAWWTMMNSFMYGDSLFIPPVFARFVSTKYTPRIEAEIYLASGEYEIVFGDALGAFGTHSYRVTAPGSEVSCLYPRVDVDPATKKGYLANCVTGNRRVEVNAWAYDDNNGWTVEDIPLVNNELDFSEISRDGPLDVEIDIDDGEDTNIIVCFQNCDRMTDPEVFTKTMTVDTSGFSGTGRITTDMGECESNFWDGVDFFHKNSPTSWTWVQWMMPGPTSLPLTGEYLARGECYDPETGVTTSSSMIFTVDGPMPNRPSNDDIQSATELTPDIGRVKFSTVSATSQKGEMGPYSSGVAADQFRSVWFKRTIAEGEGGIGFHLENSDFWAVVRVFRVTRDGRLGLVREWWHSYYDNFYENMDFEDYLFPKWVSTDAADGTTFYIQVLGDWIWDAGSAELVINNMGEGETLEVPRGDQPFTTEWNTTDFGLGTVTPSPSTTTSVPAGSDTTAPASSDTTTPAASDTTAPGKVTDTTAPASSDTTTPAASDTTAPGKVTDTTAPASSDTTAPGKVTEEKAVQLVYEETVKDASKTDVAVVLAPVESGPATVEARIDAREVEIPIADLYATVSKASAGSVVDTARPLVLRTRGQRPITVRPGDRTVTIPILAETTEMTITAVDATGKAVTAPLQVNKSQAPLVAAEDTDSGSSLPWIWIALGAIILLAGGGYVARKRLVTTTPAE